MGSEPFMAQPCPLAIGGRAVDVAACTLAFAGRELWFADRVEELGSAAMQRRRGLVDHRRV
jgi:hypothetical protein